MTRKKIKKRKHKCNAERYLAFLHEALFRDYTFLHPKLWWRKGRMESVALAVWSAINSIAIVGLYSWAGIHLGATEYFLLGLLAIVILIPLSIFAFLELTRRGR